MRALIGALLCLAACTRAPEPSRVHVRVTGVHDRPLGDVVLRIDGQPRGRTTDQGEAWLAIDATRTGRVELTIECPPDYEDPEPRRLRARHEGVRRLTLACIPRTRRAYLVVRAPGAEGLAVRVNGERLGEVGRDGLWHRAIEREAGSEVRLSVDTRGQPRLRPQHPTVQARLHRDEILLLDQSFSHVRAKRRPVPRRAPAPKPEPTVRPRRLRSL